jgi:hypothetical protein
MREKTVVFVVVCIIIVVLGIGLAEIFVFKTGSQQAPTETTMINGIPYSTKPTPYGIFTIRFFELLSDDKLQAESRTCWLLFPNEPTPWNTKADPSGTSQMAGPPPPGGDVMIDGWLYSQNPTNFIKFTLQPASITLWTETFSEPIPVNATIIQP